MNYTNPVIAEQIRNGMGFHPGNKNVAGIYEHLRNEYMALAVLVNEVVPDGRDKSLAITHLEDALMRSIRGVAINLTDLGPETVRQA